MPEIAPKEKRAKSSLTAFQAFFGKPCCRQTKYNSTGPKTRSKCEGQASRHAETRLEPQRQVGGVQYGSIAAQVRHVAAADGIDTSWHARKGRRWSDRKIK